MNGSESVGKKPSLNIIPKTKARNILDSGPAIATIASPHLAFLRLYGLKGTGLAQPKTIGDPDNTNISGKRIEPKRSMCGMGLRVRRPANFAVLSPCKYAA